jgi:hypothetical protein
MRSSIEERLRDYAELLDEQAAARADRPDSRTPSTGLRPLLVAVVVACLVATGAAVIIGDRTSDHTGGPTPATAPVTTGSRGASTVPTTQPGVPLTQPGVPLQSVDWGSVTYPVESRCGHTFSPPVVVLKVAYASPSAGTPLAVVNVRCNSGAGTPSNELYVYDRAPSASSPHLAQTLLTMTDNWQALALSVDGATISLPVNGFSTSSVPRCCPDVHATLVWRWIGPRYALVSSVPPHLLFPRGGS